MTKAIEYREFADLYDSCVRFVDDIPFFVEECERKGGPVLELTAGTGRVSIPLMEAGFDLTCVDDSDEMLAILRSKMEARNLTATVMRQDVRALDLDRTFPLALMPFHSFAEFLRDEDRRRALDAVRRHLAPGGRFVCPLHNPKVRLESIDGKPRTIGRFPRLDASGDILFRSRTSYDPESNLVEGDQIFEILDRSGEVVEERTVTVRFVLPEQDAFEGLAKETGFEVETIFGDYRRSAFHPDSSPYMIFILRLPQDSDAGAQRSLRST
jgi:SAM-dependent methyltransferase